MRNNKKNLKRKKERKKEIDGWMNKEINKMHYVGLICAAQMY